MLRLYDVIQITFHAREAWTNDMPVYIIILSEFLLRMAHYLYQLLQPDYTYM